MKQTQKQNFIKSRKWAPIYSTTMQKEIPSKKTMQKEIMKLECETMSVVL
jgi:hypothetical protein